MPPKSTRVIGAVRPVVALIAGIQVVAKRLIAVLDVHVVGRERQLAAELPLVADRRLVLPRQNAVRRVEPDAPVFRASVPGGTSWSTQRPVQRRPVDEERIGRELPVARPRIGLR